MKRICLLLLFCCSFIANSQTYELLNDIINTDKLYLQERFEIFENEDIFITKYLTDSYFINNWEPLPSKGTPDINLFLNNINFHHLKADALSNKIRLIDFKRLSERYSRVVDVNSHFASKKSYLVVSKPIFNCSKNWGIIYKHNVYKNDTASSGHIFIYRKVNHKWIYYHKIAVWIS